MAVAYEAGPTGWAIKRLLDTLGVACDAIRTGRPAPRHHTATPRRAVKDTAAGLLRSALTGCPGPLDEASPMTAVKPR